MKKNKKQSNKASVCILISKGSVLKREWCLFSNCTSESFEWESEHLEKIISCKIPKMMTKEGFSNPNMQSAKEVVEIPIEPDHTGRTELTQILKNQTTILQILVQRLTSGSSPSATVASTQRAIGAIAENQTAHLLGWSDLSWTQ